VSHTFCGPPTQPGWQCNPRSCAQHLDGFNNDAGTAHHPVNKIPLFKAAFILLASLAACDVFAGVTIFYSGQARSETDMRQALDAARSVADRFGWKVEDATVANANTYRIVGNRKIQYSGPLAGIRILASPDCEPITLQFDSHWTLDNFVKTQFAGADIHIRVVELLRAIEPYMSEFQVNDESEYWSSGNRADLERALKGNFDAMERMKSDVPGMTGPVRSADGRIHDLVNARSGGIPVETMAPLGNLPGLPQVLKKPEPYDPRSFLPGLMVLALIIFNFYATFKVVTCRDPSMWKGVLLCGVWFCPFVGAWFAIARTGKVATHDHSVDPAGYDEPQGEPAFRPPPQARAGLQLPLAEIRINPPPAEFAAAAPVNKSAVLAPGIYNADADLRFLFHEIENCESGSEWNDVIKHHWPALERTRAAYEEIRNRPCERWPQISQEESWAFYSVSRVSDLMLLRFQRGEADESPYMGPNISLDNYREFFAHLGFSEYPVREFHPFFCEIVEVIESSGPGIEIAQIKWPAIMLGNMMFARAGAVIKAPPELMAKGGADGSALYWSYRRKYRKTFDLSMGWGSNSQWRTSFRRDFELGDAWCYNVDETKYKMDLRSPFIDEKRYELAGLNRQQRIEFLRNRCQTTTNVDDNNFWPYYDYYEESKT
jgi:hypothetical protein